MLGGTACGSRTARCLGLRGLRGDGDGGIGNLLVEGGLHETEEQRAEEQVDDGDEHGGKQEDRTDDGDQTEDGQNELYADDDGVIEELGAEHLCLVAHRARAGDLDGVGDADLRLGHEDVGGEAEGVGAVDGEEHADDGNQAPQQDPQIHPGHTREHADGNLLVLEALEEALDLDLLATVAVQEDHGHRGGQQKADAEADAGDDAEQDGADDVQEDGKQGNAPEREGLFLQNVKGSQENCLNHNVLLLKVISKFVCARLWVHYTISDTK